MSELRICSLLPSTTEIVGGLGLQENLVAVTHECDVCPDEAGLARVLAAGALRVTTSEIDPHALSQKEIDSRVKLSLSAGLSLYTLKEAELRVAAPNVVLTQTLCDVCAPALDEVQAACKLLSASLPSAPTVHAFEPHTLHDVACSLEQVAAACGVPLAGAALRAEFEARLEAVRGGAARALGADEPPTLLLLEWLDPPFDGGSWVPDQIRCAGARPALGGVGGAKSVGRTWQEVREDDPDCVVVACCGFGLQRNVEDAQRALGVPDGLSSLRAWREGAVFCVDGNRYFARPSQALAPGAALLARVAMHSSARTPHDRGAELAQLSFTPEEGVGWLRLTQPKDEVLSQPHPDMEDLCDALHAAACSRGDLSYADPETGYRVMTRLAHTQRGRCCGSGCRHCPYAHAAVADKAARIQVPAFLTEPPGGLHPDGVTLLFWSGGKDSFLALRRLARPHGSLALARRRLVLISTFDACTRIVAHQEVHASQLQRQAEHLGLALLGVPLPRSASTEGGPYLDRMRAALGVLEARGVPVLGAASGDLHLAEIRAWREAQVGERLGLRLSFPLWSDVPRGNYEELSDELERSGVPCAVSAVANEAAAQLCFVGDLYDRALRTRLEAAGLDGFGEEGELHTLARVWQVSPQQALDVSD